MAEEIFEGNFADTCGEKIPLVSMGGWAEGQTYADPYSGCYSYGYPRWHKILRPLWWGEIDILDVIYFVSQENIFVKESKFLLQNNIFCHKQGKK